MSIRRSIVPVLAMLLVLPACDGDKDKPKRPDLQAPAKKADDGKARGAGGKAIGTAVEGKAAAASGRVFFVKPADGAKVPEQFEVEFGVEGKQVRPAGATERDANFGHHHVLIDTGPLADMTIVPKDETHLHYGDGATKATLELSPGKHRLTMQFADGAHRSYGPDWAATITVEVEGGADVKAADGGAAEAKADGGAAEAKAGG